MFKNIGICIIISFQENLPSRSRGKRTRLMLDFEDCDTTVKINTYFDSFLPWLRRTLNDHTIRSNISTCTYHLPGTIVTDLIFKHC